MFWAVVSLVGSWLLSTLLQPKVEPPPRAGLSDFTVPTAEEGREIPVLFGTRRINSPNVVWYGHLRTEAIRKKGGKK